MNVLLDTNVLSERARPRPDPALVRWIDELDEDRAFISVLSLAEIRRGIERLSAGNRRTHLAAWLDADLVPRFADRILTVDIPIADAWGMLMADGDRNGRPVPVIDGFLAATATAHDLALATRNTRDFAHLGIPLINPWNDDTTR
ncbi:MULTISPECIES: type II toxin-antitoxin system VapC family toxin [Protofrankia]|uniref:Ribonuclease VapC n=1 Tax=Protofrankia coriariae TaxID=1562887 RepID=A0ABR5F3P6_9ACTN|nr:MULTISPECIES: type II toxin-antitoxin system VapC family toxin [Protofrankia]KLL11346.1 recombinase [Protofrankia coriariae]ONH34899.1 VapC toxin family PIN domain ribonuclease [Protofrankia sp. BMG5.30]